MTYPMPVTAFMDVEDLVAPESDDIARDCAEILFQEGVPVTFCVVGEKARQLLLRGRDDVVAAMNQHDIGLHTDFHSVHPTIAEAMAVRNWEEGAAEAYRMEKPGVEAIETTFHRAPSCWGGPGNTWGPQVCGALLRLNIPAFVYAHTAVPDEGVHRFAGCIAYPNGPMLNDSNYESESLAEADRERVARELTDAATAGASWRQVFLGHPTRILHEQFWDAENFARGANPHPNYWKPARRKSQTDLDTALGNFRRAARMLRSLPGIELKTLDGMNSALRTARSTPLTAEEQHQVWPQIERNLCQMRNWPILPLDFNESNIVSLTRSHLGTLHRFIGPPETSA